MPVKFEKDKSNLIAILLGEIDHHTAADMRECIDEAIKVVKPEVLTLDFGAVNFMDSSGVGLIMGRYKLMSFFSGEVIVRNLSKNAEKILKLSGIEKIATIEERDEAV